MLETAVYVGLVVFVAIWVKGHLGKSEAAIFVFVHACKKLHEGDARLHNKVEFSLEDSMATGGGGVGNCTIQIKGVPEFDATHADVHVKVIHDGLEPGVMWPHQNVDHKHPEFGLFCCRGGTNEKLVQPNNVGLMKLGRVGKAVVATNETVFFLHDLHHRLKFQPLECPFPFVL